MTNVQTLQTLEGLSGPQLVTLFNSLTGQSVARFTNRQTGIGRIERALKGTSTDLEDALARAGLTANGSASEEDPAAEVQPDEVQPDEAGTEMEFADEHGTPAIAPADQDLAAYATEDADGPQKEFYRDRYGFIHRKHGAARRTVAGSSGGGDGSDGDGSDGDDAGKPKRGARRGRQTTERGPGRKEQVLGLLRRDDGATVAQIQEVTGWLPHTTRAYLSKGGALAKGGATVTSAKVERDGKNVTVYRVVA